MSEQAPEPVIQTDTPNEAPQSGGHPWDNYLVDLPESVRPLVEPIFKEWDANVTKRFQMVQSEYEPLKGFKDVVDNGWELNDVQQALMLAQHMNENPRAVYDALKNSFEFEKEAQNSAEQGQNPELNAFGDELPPEIAKELQELRANQERINSTLSQQQEAQIAAQADAQVDQIFSALKQKHGDFDEGYVAYLMFNGVDPDTAVTQYKALGQPQVQQQNPQTPVVMGSGGGLPSEAVNPASLSDKDRKNLVIGLLQANAEAANS